MWTSTIVSISSYKYYLAILDDHSHFVWTLPLHAKSDTFSTLSKKITYVSTQFGRTIKVVQCDNGHEFDNASSHAFFTTKWVILQTINNMLYSLLFQASILARYLVEGLHITTYLLNHLPTKVISTTSSYFAHHGVTPSYEHLCMFGCAYYPNLSAKAAHKLAPWFTRCVFLGYSVDHKGYRCLSTYF
jgi:hypothetical protein